MTPSLTPTRRSLPQRLPTFTPRLCRGFFRRHRLPRSGEKQPVLGGVSSKRFVRFVLEHIAREFPNREASRRFIDRVNQVIAPYIRDRGLDWEIHIDETPFDLWSINGFYPPREGTPDEKRWMADNRPSPRTHD